MSLITHGIRLAAKTRRDLSAYGQYFMLYSLKFCSCFGNSEPASKCFNDIFVNFLFSILILS